MSSSPSSEPDRWLPAGGNSSVARGEGKLRGACFSGASFTGVVAPRGAAPGAARLLAVAPFVLFELLAKVVGGKGASGSVGLTSNMPASASDCCCRNNVGEDRGVSWRNDSKSASGESRLPRGAENTAASTLNAKIQPRTTFGSFKATNDKSTAFIQNKKHAEGN
eukprot:4018945-Pleurochrysis_carterae.AAC.2